MAAMSQDVAASGSPKAVRTNLSNYWTMYYRHGMNANLQKNFYFEGTLVQAQLRAREHCDVMGYKFIWVRPLVCNIEEEEAYRKRGIVEGDTSCPL